MVALAQSAVPPADYKGPVAERPAFTLGTTFTFVNPKIGEWSYRYAGKRKGLHVFQNLYMGKPPYDWLYTPDLALVRSEGRAAARQGKLRDREYKPDNGYLRFPLFVGKEWSHDYTNIRKTDTVDRSKRAKVEAYEKVTVPAGVFWAFLIEASNQRLDREYPAYETYWYAPEVKWVVKYKSEEFKWEYELVRIDVPSQ